MNYIFLLYFFILAVHPRQILHRSCIAGEVFEEIHDPSKLENRTDDTNLKFSDVKFSSSFVADKLVNVTTEKFFHFSGSNPCYHGLFKNEDYIIFAGDNEANKNQLTILSTTTDLKNPSITSEVLLSSSPSALSFSKNNLYIYVSMFDGLVIFGIEHIENPISLGTFYNSAYEIFDPIESEDGNYLFASKWERKSGTWIQDFVVFDVSNKTNINFLSQFQLDGYLVNMVYCEDHVYIPDDGIRVMDVSDPLNVKQLLYWLPESTLVNYYDVTVDEERKLLYLANGNFGFQIVNITNPSSLKLIVDIPTKFACLISYSQETQHLYVVDNVEGIMVYDVKDVYNPILLGKKKLENISGYISQSDSYEMEEKKGILYILEHNSGITIYDTNKMEMETKGTCEYGKNIIEFDVCETYKENTCNSYVIELNGQCQEEIRCGNGTISPYCTKCLCNVEYYGDECQFWKCNEIFNNETQVCSGQGSCESPGVCSCKDNLKTSIYSQFSYGNDCEKLCEQGSLEFGGDYCIGFTTTVVFGSAILVGSVLLVVVSICAVIVIILMLCSCVLKFKKKANRFDHIEGVDMILKEVELEQKSTTPQINLKKVDYIIPYEDITLKEVIGSGGSNSSVFKAEWKGVSCAYKGFRYNNFTDTNNSYDEFEKEVAVCVALNHPSILQFFGACINPPKVGLVIEYAENGDIPKFLGKYLSINKKKYPIKEKLRLLQEIISGMEYLHFKKYIHRDLKPENILINGEEKAKIMDFGLAKMKETPEKTMTSKIGTGYYMAPEVMSGKEYSFPCDVFSWAILSLVIISENFNPYQDTSGSKVMMKVLKDVNYRPIIEEKVFEKCKFLIPIIKKNWSFNPKDRNTFSELKKIFEKEMGKLKK